MQQYIPDLTWIIISVTATITWFYMGVHLGKKQGIKIGHSIGVDHGRNDITRKLWNQMNAVGREADIEIDGITVKIRTVEVTTPPPLAPPLSIIRPD